MLAASRYLSQKEVLPFLIKGLYKHNDIIDAQYAEFAIRGYDIEKTLEINGIHHGFHFNLNKNEILVVRVWTGSIFPTHPVKIALSSNSSKAESIFQNKLNVKKLGSAKKLDKWFVFLFYDEILNVENCHHKIFQSIEEVITALELSPKSAGAEGHA